MIHIIKILSMTLLLVAILFGFLYFSGSRLLPVVSNNPISENAGVNLLDKVGSRASFFDLPDTKSGRIKLSDFDSTPLIIFFWSTWDANSSNQVKIFNDYLANEALSKRSIVKIVGINSQEDMSIASSFMRRGGYSVPVAVDSSGAITENYGVKGLPTIFFVDRHGIIRQVWGGVLSLRDIVDKVEVILK